MINVSLKVNHRKWIVYHHIHNGKVFYVGMGRLPRPFTSDGRSTTWFNFVKYLKGDFEIKIVGVFRLKSSANNFEMKEIKRTKAPINKENRGIQWTMKPKDILDRLEKQIA